MARRRKLWITYTPPAQTLATIRARLVRLADSGALSDVQAQVLLARAAEAGAEARRAMEPNR